MIDNPTPQDDEGDSLPDEMPDEWVSLMSGHGSPVIPNARIVRIEDEAAWFDIGSKFEAPIPLSDWQDESSPRVGDEFDVFVDDQYEVDDGPLRIVRLFDCKIPRNTDWDDIIETISPGETRIGRIARRIKGGFLVDIGVNVFLPDECATTPMLADPEAFMDQQVTCRITAIEREMRNIRVALG